MKKVVITGVSTGIGYSSAKILCNSGYIVYGSVRKSEDVERIADKLGENFHPLMFDVTRGLDKQLKSAKDKLKSYQLEVQKKQGKSASELAFKRLATTRQSFEHILDAITFVALCDKEKRENKRSRKSIAKELDIPYSSAKSKYQTGTKIIISGQIRKYFPEFRFE